MTYISKTTNKHVAKVCIQRNIQIVHCYARLELKWLKKFN